MREVPLYRCLCLFGLTMFVSPGSVICPAPRMTGEYHSGNPGISNPVERVKPNWIQAPHTPSMPSWDPKANPSETELGNRTLTIPT